MVKHFAELIRFSVTLFRGQGIAYRQIEIDENADVYPMVSSTAAKSGVRLINATSFVENLQYLCVKVVSKNRESVEVR